MAQGNFRHEHDRPLNGTANGSRAVSASEADRTWRPVALDAAASSSAAPVPAPTAVLVLAGGLRPSPLSAACGRSVLDLPLTSEHTVLSHWMKRFSELGSRGGSPRRPEVRIIHNQATHAPVLPSRPALLEAITECESREYRGPAGVAKDACERYAPDATIVIVEGARCVTCSLEGLLREHAATSAAVTVGCNPDRSPAGVYAIRRSALDLVPRGGFMDLKEQWLSKVIASGADVRVHTFHDGISLPLRTLEQYLSAVGEVNRWADSSVQVDNLSSGACDRVRREHVVVASSASVSPDAVLIDSVVMPGAVIGAGAVVARSLVCEGAVVRAGAEVVGAVVAGKGGSGGAKVVVRNGSLSKANG